VESSRCISQNVVVVGGGNSAGQAALHLSRSAAHVYLFVRAAKLQTSMSDYLVQRLRSCPRVTICVNTEVEAISGQDRISMVTSINRLTLQRTAYAASDVFVMIGADPNTDWLLGRLELDRSGFVKTGHLLSNGASPFVTSRPGVFAIGDVRAESIKRVAAAVGEGSAVISDVHRHLEAQKAAEPLKHRLLTPFPALTQAS
jgi:thioredoxin reductase (NADPH)